MSAASGSSQGSVPATQAAPSALRHAWPCVAAACFVLAMIAARWDARAGWTPLLRFGGDFSFCRLAVVAALPVAVTPGPGYDGQFYAQLAVAPDVRRADVQRAVDDVRCRARRILLPVIAHVLGGGRPWACLQVFSLLNVAAWLFLGWRLWRLVAPWGWHGTAVWFASMLSLGALESLRQALTDLPALCLVFLAVECAQCGRRVSGIVLMALGGLTRETALLAAPALAGGKWRDRRTWATTAGCVLLASLPLVCWVVWLTSNVPSNKSGGMGNLDWPGCALLRHGATCVRHLVSGDFDGRYSFGLLAAAGFAYQAVFVLRRAGDASPWLRMGVLFAALFFVLGGYVWHGYWAAARVCLPLTFAYNLSLPRDHTFAWRLTLGNLCLLHGVWRLLPDL